MQLHCYTNSGPLSRYGQHIYIDSHCSRQTKSVTDRACRPINSHGSKLSRLLIRSAAVGIDGKKLQSDKGKDQSAYALGRITTITALKFYKDGSLKSS
ncbi:hypothetical protein DSUL_40036 [Desulfovibrionales bacterium]